MEPKSEMKEKLRSSQIIGVDIQRGYSDLDSAFYRNTHKSVIQKAQEKQMFSQRLQTFYKSNAFKIIMGIIFNTLSIILFITQTYLSARNINLGAGPAVFVKMILVIFFFVEYVDYIIDASNKVKEFFRLFNLFDFFTIIFLVDDIYNDIEQGRNSMEDKMLWLLLSFKVLKVKEGVFSLSFKTHENPNPDKVAKIIPVEKQIKMASYSTFMNIVSLCIITTSFIMFVDELLNYTLYSPFDKGRILEFHNALYFQILTMTTIGYGDITPASGISRFITTIFIFIIIALFSMWVSIIINLHSKRADDSNYRSKQIDDYVVVIGNLVQNTSHLEQFLINHFDERYAKDSITKFQKQLLIVTVDEFDHDPNAYINFELLRTTYKIKKIQHMKLQSLDNDIGWIKKAQLIRASTLVCFNVQENHEKAVNQERNWIFLLGIIHKTYPHIKLYLYFSTQIILNEARLFGEQERYKLQRVNCQKQVLNYVLAQSIENEGVGSMLQHLLMTNAACNPQTKNFFSNLNTFNNLNARTQFWLEKSFQGINSVVCIRPLPLFFQGDTFINLAKFFYFYSCKKSEEIYGNREGQTIRAILIGIKSYMDKKVLLNPSFYRIQEGDKAIFVTNNQNTIDFFEGIQQFHKEEFDKEMEYPVLHNAQGIIRDLITKYSIEKKQTKPDREPIIINLNTTSIQQELRQHIILIGISIEDAPEIVQGIRKQNRNRQIVFYFDNPVQQIPTSLKKDKQLVFAIGKYSSFKNLRFLNCKKAYRILIRFEPVEDFKNMDKFQLYRNLKKNYPNAHLMISTSDSRVLQFLDQRPKQKKINYELWPLCLKGRLIDEQVIFHSLNSLIYYQKSISNCVLKMIGISRLENVLTHMDSSHFMNQSNVRQQMPKYQQQQQQKQEQQELKIESKLFTIELSEKCVKYIKQFGDLQYYLMTAKYPLIALAILKQKENYQGQNNNYESNSRVEMGGGNSSVLDDENDNQQDANKEDQLWNEKIDLAQYTDEIMALNPPPYQEYLQAGDKIIVLGNAEANIDTQQLKKTQDENMKFETIFQKIQQEQDQKRMNFIETVFSGKNGHRIINDHVELTQKVTEVYQAYSQLNYHREIQKEKQEASPLKKGKNRRKSIIQNKQFEDEEEEEEEEDEYDEDIDSLEEDQQQEQQKNQTQELKSQEKKQENKKRRKQNNKKANQFSDNDFNQFGNFDNFSSIPQTTNVDFDNFNKSQNLNQNQPQNEEQKQSNLFGPNEEKQQQLEEHNEKIEKEKQDEDEEEQKN